MFFRWTDSPFGLSSSKRALSVSNHLHLIPRVLFFYSRSIFPHISIREFLPATFTADSTVPHTESFSSTEMGFWVKLHFFSPGWFCNHWTGGFVQIFSFLYSHPYVHSTFQLLGIPLCCLLSFFIVLTTKWQFNRIVRMGWLVVQLITTSKGTWLADHS